MEQAGTVNGKVEGAGDVTKYVARVGNTGYESLELLWAAVKASGGTITLLQNATLKADITISKNITIDGQGQFKIEAQPKNSHAITVASNATLTLKDVMLNITDQEEQNRNLRSERAVWSNPDAGQRRCDFGGSQQRYHL